MKNKNKAQVTMNRSHQHGSVKAFYGCLRTSLLMFKLLGFLPIEGLLSTDSSKTRFNLKSLYALICVIELTLQHANLILVYSYQTYSTSIVNCTVGLLTGTACAGISISLLRLCIYWRPFINKIESIETLLPPLRGHKIIVNRINWFVGVIVLIALVEHVTYIAYTAVIVKHCFLQESDSGLYLKSYALAAHKSTYAFISFSYTSAILVQIIKFQTVIACTLGDIFIVVCTVYLSQRFKDFYRIMVQTIKNKAGGQTPWSDIQIHYTRLTALVLTVDHLISPVIFTALLSHMLLICKQIYNVMRKKQMSHIFVTTECVSAHSNESVTYVYLTVALVKLLLRSMLVSLMSAHMHTLSRQPLNALHTVSPSVYNKEMQKFIDQVYHSKICLSGLRFFYVTRGTVLSMVSTILTYELVLLQIPDENN